MRLVKHRGKFTAVIDGKRYSTGLDAKRENRDAAERKAHEIEQTLNVAFSDTVEDIVTAYLKDKKGVVIDHERLTYAWKALKPHFGKMSPQMITRETCRKYAADRKVAPATVNKELRTLRAALRWHDKFTPATIEMLPSTPPRDRWLTREEFRRLLDAAGSPHVRVFLNLAIATAARKEAILDLRWDKDVVGVGYVDFERGEIDMGRRHNGKKRARVPMTNSVRAVLEEARKAALTPYVVEFGDGRIQNIRKGVQNAVARAGLTDVHIHDLRHTAAVWMCERGVPLEMISAYLGHSDIRVTQQVYARHQPDHLKDAASALEL